jgi:hypothetical protein
MNNKENEKPNKKNEKPSSPSFIRSPATPISSEKSPATSPSMNVNSSSEMKHIRSLLEKLVKQQDSVAALNKPPKGSRVRAIINPCGAKSALRSDVTKLLSNSLGLYWGFFNQQVFPVWWIDKIKVMFLIILY